MIWHFTSVDTPVKSLTFAPSVVIDLFKERHWSNINGCRVTSKGVSQVLTQVLASTIRAATRIQILWIVATVLINRSSNSSPQIPHCLSSQWYREDEQSIMWRLARWIRWCQLSRWCRRRQSWVKLTWTTTQRRRTSWAFDHLRHIIRQPLTRQSPRPSRTTSHKSTSNQISRT